MLYLIALQFVAIMSGIIAFLLVLSGAIIALEFAWNVLKAVLNIKE